ncbi:helix-turn-helix domain-containing protein [Nonomuraea sp. NPDC059023]|uniref:helix-turn-helix domain-containing protein n=1 Tax=unclassified Nonomuraea TaxID=2593643 RepID=UPI003677A5F5
MDPAEPVGRALAANLRAARQARGWRLEDLAARSGVSRGMLQQIETGRTNPSIATLARICSTLGVSIGRLVEPPEELGHVVRAAEVAIRPAGAGGQARLLINDGRAELWDFVIAPGEEVRSPGHPEGTGELLHVNTGELAVTVGGAAFSLGPGDALRMRGDRPHAYANPGAEPVRFTMTVIYGGRQDPRYAM